MSIPTSALVECPNNAILYVMVLDGVESVKNSSYEIYLTFQVLGFEFKSMNNLLTLNKWQIFYYLFTKAPILGMKKGKSQKSKKMKQFEKTVLVS